MNSALRLVCMFILSLPLLTAYANALSPFEDANPNPGFLEVDQAFSFNYELQEKGLLLSWDIEDGYYLYQERFKFTADNPNVSLGEPEFSYQGTKKEDPYFGEVHVMYDDLTVFLPVSFQKSELQEAEITVRSQGCADAGLCYPPKKEKVLFLASQEASPSISNEATSTQATENTPTTTDRNMDDASDVSAFIAEKSLATVIGIFFLLGIGLTFTPCVFPMIPIISSVIAGQSNPTPFRSFSLALSYVLGMATTYAAAGTLTGLLGAGANIQAALQNPFLLSFFAVVFVLLALSMFGLYEIQLPARLRDSLNDKSQSLSGGKLGSVFGIGALSALVVSPCVSAPLAGALLYISSTGDAVLGGSALLSMGLGMGVPLIAIAVGGGKLFPKAGAWMDGIKAVFGIMLIAVAIWLIGRFADPTFTLALWAVLAVVTGVYMGAFEQAASNARKLLKGFGLVFVTYGAAMILGVAMGNSDPLKPLHNSSFAISGSSLSSGTKNDSAFANVYGLNDLERELSVAKQQGKPVLVDFYADWCISCVTMEREVFPQAPVKAEMEKFHLVKADVTNNSDENKALLEHFGLFGPPSFLFFTKTGDQIKDASILGEIDQASFIKRMQYALAI